MSTTAGERHDGEQVDGAFDRRLVAPMVLGSVLNPVNSSLIAVALVPIGLALHAPAAQTAWLVSGLYLATAVGQPVTGRLVDLWGPRPLYLAGAVLMIVGGVLGALAPSIAVLVAARVLIGLGSCAGYPSAMALVRREARRTGRDSPEGVLTVLAVSTQTVAVVGPTLGGLLIGVGGWRTVFWVNVPLALACLVAGLLRLPREDRRDGAGEGFARTVDPAGIGLFTAALVTLLLFLLHPTPGHAYLLGAAVAAAGLLGWWERRAVHPFLDLAALAGRPALLLTYLRALLTALVSYCLLYGFTQWLEQGRGLSASEAGLVLVPVFLTGLGVSALTGRRREIRGKLVVGAVAQVLVAVVLLLLGPTSPIWLIVVAAAIAGIPQGLNNLALQNAVYRQADPARTASSAGLMRTAFYLGAIASSTVGGVAFAAHGATTPGLHVLAVVMLAAAVVFLLVTVFDRGLGRLAAHPS